MLFEVARVKKSMGNPSKIDATTMLGNGVNKYANMTLKWSKMRSQNDKNMLQHLFKNASKNETEKCRVQGSPRDSKSRTAGRAEAPGGGYREGFITSLLQDCEDCKTGD